MSKQPDSLSAEPARMPLHHVQIRIAPRWITASFTCPGPAGAFCRLVCAERCDDPEFPCHDLGDDRAQHDLIDSGSCNVVLSLTEAGAEHSYIGPPTAAHDGPIQVGWTGEDYVWAYAPADAESGWTTTGGSRRSRRIQMSRQRPLPHGSRSVATPTRWANPYRPAQRSWEANAVAVERYETWIRNQPDLLAHLDELRGYDLACWCPSDLPCHADVLLKLLDEHEQND